MSKHYLHLGLIGYPIEHSYSAILHTAALKAHGLNGEYNLHKIPPLPDGEKKLEELFNFMREGEITGLNVTIPHKRNVIRFLDKLSDISTRIDAVNTIAFQNGCLFGTNTDADGFLNDLKIKAAGYIVLEQSVISDSANRANALILGAGGAARAIAFSLLVSGWNITIAARKLEQARSLMENLNRHFVNSIIKAVDLSKNVLEEVAGDISLLINATSAGMFPNADLNSWPEGVSLPPECFVYDLVYNPGITKLMKQAEIENIPNAGGIGMLVEQAVLSFEIWTGMHVSREVLFESIRDIM